MLNIVLIIAVASPEAKAADNLTRLADQGHQSLIVLLEK